ncbi:MAG: hypothetical protein IMW89_22265, partial [Ktedonobacteraceae bacterium]|nr:hypothetical protein [Ktedonobacteraceae bacterium]
MADSYIEVSKEAFAEVISNADPSQILAVNFTSGQSNICQIQEPEFIAISREYQDRITFAKVNVEEQGKFTQRWHVEGVPTLVFFKGG